MKLINFGVLLIILIITLTVVFSKSEISSDKFNSHRLGNVIDQWYTSSKFPDTGNYQKMIQKDPPNKDKDSLSQYLIQNVREYDDMLNSDTKNILKQQVKGGFLSYHYDRIILCVNDFHYNLNNIMKEYDNIHNNVLTNQHFEDDTHCIVHFRLGDYVSLGDVIDYNYTIDAMKNLNKTFSVIELMDGGKSHKSTMFSSFSGFKNYFNNHEISKSEQISNDFIEKLKQTFPSSKVIQSEKRSPDEDFYRMSYAPILITAGGSFAITAAIGGKSKIIRTPSCKTLDFPSKGCENDVIIPKNQCDWKTYQYKML